MRKRRNSSANWPQRNCKIAAGASRKRGAQAAILPKRRLKMATKAELDRIAEKILEQDRVLTEQRRQVAAKEQAERERIARTAEIVAKMGDLPEADGFGWTPEREAAFAADVWRRQELQIEAWRAKSAEQRAKQKRLAAISCGFTS